MQNPSSWLGHELVPYSIGRDFTPNDQWHSEEYPLSNGMRSAIYVNLLTEDNLPYYSSFLLHTTKREHPFNAWIHQWTMEEAKHADVIRDWVYATRAIDPRLLEAGRVVQMTKGEVPEPDTFAETTIYTTFQELATRVAHSNVSRNLDAERGGKKVFSIVAGDESKHNKFYGGLASEGFKINPSLMTIAAYLVVKSFQMPGTGIPNFKEHSLSIAKEEIFSPKQLLNVVLEPEIKKWDIEHLDKLSPEAELARDGLYVHISRLEKLVNRIEERKQVS